MSVTDLEQIVRPAAFVAILVILIVLEFRLSQRRRSSTRRLRWPGNALLTVTSVLAVRLLVPVSAAAVALTAQQNGFGFFNIVASPAALSLVLSVILLDFAIYGQHVFSHRYPPLWRLHRLHHSDVDVDVTTALRFHPLEIVLSMFYKLVVVALIGAPPTAVVLFEIILNGAAMFNHSNFRLTPAIEKILKPLLVTPLVHRIHHSTERSQTDSNYGFALPWWDMLFGTYVTPAADGSMPERTGLDQFREDAEQKPLRLLTQPFVTGGSP